MITTADYSRRAALAADLLKNASFAVLVLNEIFSTLPGRFRFTSGYRTAAENAAAGGVENSFHMRALAGDFVPVDGRYPASEKNAIAAITAKYGYEVIAHNAGNGMHYHIEPSPSFNYALIGAAPETTAGITGGAAAVLLLLFFLASD